MDDKMQECIGNCNQCADVCREALEYCQNKGGAHADPKHLQLLQDCIKICETAADFMQRESGNHPAICEVCANICEQCAESCEAMGDDEIMQKCAEICRMCARSCREMSVTT